MARIRSIKPEFWIDEKTVELSAWARLLFIGMWNFADDQGFVDYKPKRLKMQIFPAENIDVEPLLAEIFAQGMVKPYDSPIGPVLDIINWNRHQRVDKPAKPRFDRSELRPLRAAPPDPPEHSRNAPGMLPEPSRGVGEPNGALDEGSAPKNHAEQSDDNLRNGDLGIRGVLPEPSTNLPGTFATEGKGREGKGEEVPPTAGAVAPQASPPDPVTTDQLIADWLDHIPKRPPGQVIGQVGKSVKTMLGEGIDPADVRRGIAAWSSKGLHPSVLASVVNQVMNAGRTRDAPPVDRRQQATNDMFARAAARAAVREEHPHDPARSRDVVPIRPGVLPPAAHG